MEKKNSSGVLLFVIVIILLIAATSGHTTTHKHTDIQARIEGVFGAYSQQAIDIATCESSLNPSAINNQSIEGSNAAGLFQILYPSTWDTTSYKNDSPYDVDANIHAAWEIFSRDGYSWREWECKP